MPILPNENVYRAIRSRSWVDEKSNRVSPAAFMLREMSVDEYRSGLSVLIEIECSASVCSASLNRCFGEILLRSARILDVGLSIIVDDYPHAEIRGLPSPRSGLFAEAERLATKLSEGASFQFRPTA
jgi:hypothetical protein